MSTHAQRTTRSRKALLLVTDDATIRLASEILCPHCGELMGAHVVRVERTRVQIICDQGHDVLDIEFRENADEIYC
jgi:hypothetical protein